MKKISLGPDHSRSLMIFVCALICCANWIFGQGISKFFSPGSRLNFQLPWSGTGAAAENPAFLADSQLVNVNFSRYATVSGKMATPFLQGSVTVEKKFSFGLAWTEKDSDIDGIRSVYAEMTYLPMFAALIYSQPEGMRITAGLDVPIYEINTFDVIKRYTWSLDIGITAETPVLRQFGKLQIGLAALTLRDLRFEQLDGGSKNYPIQMRNFHGSVLWNSLEHRYTIFSKLNIFNGKNDLQSSSKESQSFEFNLNNFGFEVRPREWIGFKWERTETGMATLGVTSRLPSWNGWSLAMEFNGAAPKLLPYYAPEFLTYPLLDDGLGLRWSYFLSLGFK